MKIIHDGRRCSSLGMCESVAPEFFEIGEDGALTVLDADPPLDRRALIEEAVAACPTGALSLQD